MFRAKDPQERLEQLRRLSLLELEHLKQSASSPDSTPLRQLPEHSVSSTQQQASPPAGLPTKALQETEIENKSKVGESESAAPVRSAPRPPAVTLGSETEMSTEKKPVLQVPNFQDTAGGSKVESLAGEQTKEEDDEETVLSPSQQS